MSEQTNRWSRAVYLTTKVYGPVSLSVIAQTIGQPVSVVKPILEELAGRHKVTRNKEKLWVAIPPIPTGKEVR